MFVIFVIVVLDLLWGLIVVFCVDFWFDKVDFVVGVYCDDSGQMLVMVVVKVGEECFVVVGVFKVYCGLVGNVDFNVVLVMLLFGNDVGCLVCQYMMQIVGGIGVFRLFVDFIVVVLFDVCVWVLDFGYVNYVFIM